MDGLTQVGLHALINLIISLASIFLCWRILLFVRIEEVLKVKNIAQKRVLLLLLSIVLGHNIAEFLIRYYEWSSLLGHLIQ